MGAGRDTRMVDWNLNYFRFRSEKIAQAENLQLKNFHLIYAAAVYIS